MVVALGGTLVVVSATNWYSWKKRDGRLDGALGWFPFVLSNVGIGIMTGFVGPLLFIPMVTLLNSMIYAAQSDFRLRPSFFLVTIAPVLVPFALQQLGVLAPWYAFEGGELRILAHMVAFRPAPTSLFFVMSACVMCLAPLAMVHRLKAALDASERRLFLGAWHLRQLLPKDALSKRS